MSVSISPGSAAWTDATLAELVVDNQASIEATAGAASPTAPTPPGLAGRIYLGGAKRVVDVATSLLFLVLLSPILLLIAVWIRIDSPGNPLYRQTRIGRNGDTFTLYKFRTMSADPSDAFLWIIDHHGNRRHKIRNDPRITRAGAWLRRSSVDELPQLWNVLRGDMSLVGPRPELPEIVEEYDEWQHRRHNLRPGLTGWWQVSGRSDNPMHEHTELDLYYVDHASFRLDFLIAIRTVGVVIRGLGAF